MNIKLFATITLTSIIHSYVEKQNTKHNPFSNGNKVHLIELNLDLLCVGMAENYCKKYFHLLVNQSEQ